MFAGAFWGHTNDVATANADEEKKNPLSCGVQAFAAAGFDPEEGPMCLTLSTLFSPSVDPSCLSCNSF